MREFFFSSFKDLESIALYSEEFNFRFYKKEFVNLVVIWSTLRPLNSSVSLLCCFLVCGCFWPAASLIHPLSMLARLLLGTRFTGAYLQGQNLGMEIKPMLPTNQKGRDLNRGPFFAAKKNDEIIKTRVIKYLFDPLQKLCKN